MNPTRVRKDLDRRKRLTQKGRWHTWERDDFRNAFEAKRVDCLIRGEEWPWQTLAALRHDVEHAVDVTIASRLMAEILDEAHQDAQQEDDFVYGLYDSSRLVSQVIREVEERNAVTALEAVFSPEEEFSLDEPEELVYVPDWSGMHITSRP